MECRLGLAHSHAWLQAYSRRHDVPLIMAGFFFLMTAELRYTSGHSCALLVAMRATFTGVQLGAHTICPASRPFLCPARRPYRHFVCVHALLRPLNSCAWVLAWLLMMLTQRATHTVSSAFTSKTRIWPLFDPDDRDDCPLRTDSRHIPLRICPTGPRGRNSTRPPRRGARPRSRPRPCRELALRG